jgi:hypothetical protein
MPILPATDEDPIETDIGRSRLRAAFLRMPVLQAAVFRSFVFVAAFHAFSVVNSVRGEQPTWRLPHGAEYSFEERTLPRPLRIHRLVLDLTQPSIPLGISAGPDPDGEGPAEVALKAPDRHARDARFLAAINTNAWVMLPDPTTGKTPGYVVDGPADIKGWTSTGTRLVSPPERGYWSVWQEESGRIRLHESASKETTSRTEVRWAISGFRGILQNSKKLVDPSNVLHPRTALGISHEGMRMVWLVVDGRQPMVSEGVSEEELAELMLESGCHDAINLDGGGSSVLVMTDEKGQLRIANRPSGRVPRPVPVMLGIPTSKP